MCASNKYAHQIPGVSHMFKLLDVHQWREVHQYICHMSSVASTVWPEVLYTDDNDDGGQRSPVA